MKIILSKVSNMRYLSNIGSILLQKTIGRKFSSTSSVLNKMNDFQMKKITQEFDHIYDTNKDGYVDKKDIEGFKRKLRNYLVEQNQDLKRDSYKAGYDDYWEILHEFADTNKDREISRNEWIDMWSKIILKAKDNSFKSLPQWVQIMPSSIFPVMDFNRDNKITIDEYSSFWSKVGGYTEVTDSQIKEMFNVMTENGKYDLTVPRVEELYADFYLSNDMSTPGRFIGGPIDYSNC